MRMLGDKENNDVEVTWEDQQNINKFSRLHATFTDIEEEIQVRRREREDLDDLSMELELMDEDATVMYQVGEAYVDMPQSDALVQLEKDTKRTNDELERLQTRMDECEKGMSELKVLLYARFGANINLER